MTTMEVVNIFNDKLQKLIQGGVYTIQLEKEENEGSILTSLDSNML